MGRISPRTCLWPLTISLLLTFGLSVGLTFRSNHHCYAGTCGEWLFPLQARVHVVLWYSWISISVTILSFRAFSSTLRKYLRLHLLYDKLPVIGKHLSPSGILLFFWVLSLYGALVAVWWIRLRDYFDQRGRAGGVFVGNDRLAAVALTGHLCDVTFGMVLLPVSRHSALSSFFKLSVSTTLAFHMVMAYTLFALVLIHGFLYVSWVVVFNSLSEQLRLVFPVLNPTYLYEETWPGNASSLGVWRASLIFTGIFASIIMFGISITTLAPVRAKHFNVFYFTHLSGILAVIVICLHASTMFYCMAPGLAMWILDWGMRLHELRKRLDGEISSIGQGWYRLTVPLPRHRLDGCACTSPLAHFYIHHSGSSMRELHPFTTITPLASHAAILPKSEDDILIQFLFRKSGGSVEATVEPAPVEKGFATIPAVKAARKKRKNGAHQWTNKLASVTDRPEWDKTGIAGPASAGRHPLVSFDSNYSFPSENVALRLEGPYFTPAEPARYNTVVCLVAGTGVSGAIAIARAFVELESSHCCARKGPDSDGPPLARPPSFSESSSRVWRKCVVVWSVRDGDQVSLPFYKDSVASAGLEVHTHLTGEGRPRLDMNKTLSSIVDESPGDSVWVYLSGPNRFIEAGEQACQALSGVAWYAARWDI